jgi:protein-S-isoprenylcysteine O-methyltransferase Ste14
VDKRLSRWGVGPKTFAPAVVYLLAAWAVTSAWPGVCKIPSPPGIVDVIAAVLIGLGVALWLTGIITVMRAYGRDQLATSGVFALVRHPVYAAWITLILPGLALRTRSWPMLLTSLVAYAIFKRLIPREDKYLTERFGQAYLDYRRCVNEVIPIPRFR